MQSNNIREISRYAAVYRTLPVDAYDLHAVIARARAERSQYIGNLAAKAVRSIVSRLKSARACRQAFAHVSAMSDRELSDIGLTRSEIRAAVYAGHPHAQAKSGSFLSKLRRFLLNRFAKRASYLELMSLDDHLLQDIGVARSEVGGFVRSETSMKRSAANRNKPRSVA